MAISPDSRPIPTQCEWRQVNDNEYRRPLFANEKFLAIKSLFDGTCTMISSITVKNIHIESVRAAWTKFPLLMPLVRMQLQRCQTEGSQNEMEFTYLVPQRPVHDLEEWSQRTCKIHEGLSRRRLQEQAIDGRNQLRPVNECDASDVAHLYVSKDGNGVHLVFSFQHAATDARGQWMMIDSFLKLCSGELAVEESTYHWGIDDVGLLPRPFHYAAGLRQDGDLPPFNALEMIHGHIASDNHLVPFAGLPALPSAIPSTAVLKPSPIQSLTIPAEDYKLLHGAAKVNGSTASAWVGAVLTLLMFELNHVKDFKTIRFPLQPVDARRYMPDGSQGYYGVAIGGGNVDMKDLTTIQTALSDLEEEGPIPASFWAVSREYKEGLERLTKDRDGVLAAKEVLNVICPYVLADPKIGDMASVFYTSLGRAKTYLKLLYGRSDIDETAVKLEDLETFPLFHNTLLTMCSLMEFKGDIKITYQIPNNTYHASLADTFANRLASIIRRLVDGARCVFP